MKALLLRVGALGTVAVLGWIAIANAQRGNSVSTAEDSTAGSVAVITEGPARPMVTPPTGDANPLRTSATSSARPYPASTPKTEPAARRPVADPFGLQARRNDSATVTNIAPPSGDSIPDASALGLAQPQNEARSQYPEIPVAASVEQSPAGPALVPNNPMRPADNRLAARPERVANRNADRYTAPAATTDNQEPALLNVEPFATPANPTKAANAARTVKAEPGTLAPLAGGRPTGELATEAEGVGQPGNQQLEGVQSPQLTIQKTAPKEIQVGKPASFRVTVRNTGRVSASDVEVRDMVPKGTRLVGTTPQSTRGTRGEIVWTLGTIQPGEESTVEMQLMPTAEGEIGSVATVHFGADASARSIATRPQLAVQTTAPDKVLIGDKMMLTITVSNPGTGVATGVVLEERIPPGFQHPAGTELEYEVGDLKPGESRKLELPLVANQPGPATNLLSVRGDGSLRAEDKRNVEVLAPQLDVVMEGPKRRYLERQATYQLSVSNPGTASAKQVELVASLPAGLKFVSANNAGYYEEASRTVRWRLEELPANETGSVELVTMPVEAGQHALKLRGTAQKGLAVEKEQPVSVEGIAAILFQVSDSADPIEVGGETTYEVHVVNQGSKAATNVQLAIDLPPELKATAAEGPTRNRTEGSRVLFDGLARLAPKAETTYRLRVKSVKSGDLRTRFQLMTDDMQSPVTKEESTRVFADE